MKLISSLYAFKEDLTISLEPRETNLLVFDAVEIAQS